jgi:hypothetical protein
MKTKLSLFLLIFSYLLIGIVSAQDVAFRVLATKGVNSVNGHNLIIGSEITNNQIIKVGTGSYLGLAHKNGGILELKEEGIYKVADLEAKLTSNASRVTSKYIDFIISELTKKQDADEMAHRYKHMHKTETVFRCPCDPITVILANKEEILGDKAAITWFVNEKKLPKGISIDQITDYQVTVMNLFGNVVYQIETQANTLVIDFKKEGLEDKFFTYKIRVKGNEKITSEERSFIKMKDKKAKMFFNEYNELTQNNTALGKIIQAKYLEEQGLFPEAMAAYYEALTLEVGVEVYQRLYDEFMDRAGFSKDAYLGKNKKDRE